MKYELTQILKKKHFVVSLFLVNHELFGFQHGVYRKSALNVECVSKSPGVYVPARNVGWVPEIG